MLGGKEEREGKQGTKGRGGGGDDIVEGRKREIRNEVKRVNEFITRHCERSKKGGVEMKGKNEGRKEGRQGREEY